MFENYSKSFIYGLFDPRTPEIIRYIGRTKNMKIRLASHLYKKFSWDKKTKWIKSLRSIGLKPCIKLIDTVPTEEVKLIEKGYIKFFNSEFLLNEKKN